MDPADGADTPVEQSVMIALLPIASDWCKLELPHMTLVYAGEIPDLNPSEFNEIAKDAASIAMLSGPITLKVTGIEVFGDTDKVDVLKLQPTSELLAMRRMVENWNASDFPFSPHATIGPVGSSVALQQTGDIPRWVAFNRVYVGWGEESLTFLMNTRNSGY
jgi:2'-5' RNA ligase